MKSYNSKSSDNSNLQGIKYNLGNGKFTDSKRELNSYLKKEVQFYQKLFETYHSHSLKRKSYISSDLSSLFA